MLNLVSSYFGSNFKELCKFLFKVFKWSVDDFHFKFLSSLKFYEGAFD